MHPIEREYDLLKGTGFLGLLLDTQLIVHVHQTLCVFALDLVHIRPFFMQFLDALI